ncbi:membrane fusion protein (multidrug efflux system) [Azospirillum agricola]|uniref:HlyD family secretion protein n=1 Tax=Azospirillum agricola TaxID=1720247 RepID=UPI002D808452|nr:HlyD family secretion protein [Azospirillum agricola]MBP2230462.1 membrane fusion protein (multidrug efflux system) [Azospirillum agricola]
MTPPDHRGPDHRGPDHDAERAVVAPPASPPATAAPVAWSPWLVRSAVLALALLLLAAFVTRWDRWVGSAVRQTTNDAYLQADTTPLAAQVSGTVRSVPVGDFQWVKAGDPLAVITDDEYRARVAEAEAALEAADAAIALLDIQKRAQQSLIDQAEANVHGLEADAWRARLEERRQQDLSEQGLAGTLQALQQAQAAARRAESTLGAGRALIDQQKATLVGLDVQQRQARATRQQREAALALARIDLDRTTIRAPADGMVGQRQARPGQFVAVGSQIITLVPLPNVWVVANYKETQMTRLRVGQPATIRVDSFPDTPLTGRVESHSPASGSQFALLPPENATGNFTKIVQRIPVKIVLDTPHPLMDRLRPGMSVEVSIDTTGDDANGSDRSPAVGGGS